MLELVIPASVPERFWGEAALTAVHIINRLPSPITRNKSPFELLYVKTLDYSTWFVSIEGEGGE